MRHAFFCGLPSSTSCCMHQRGALTEHGYLRAEQHRRGADTACQRGHRPWQTPASAQRQTTHPPSLGHASGRIWQSSCGFSHRLHAMPSTVRRRRETHDGLRATLVVSACYVAMQRVLACAESSHAWGMRLSGPSDHVLFHRIGFCREVPAGHSLLPAGRLRNAADPGSIPSHCGRPKSGTVPATRRRQLDAPWR